MPVSLERRDAEKNVFRFYQLGQDTDLFGMACVTRHWGRIGTQGRQMIQAFESADAASRALTRLSRAKLRRGYAEVPVSR